MIGSRIKNQESKLSLVVVLARGRVEFPAVAIAFDDLLLALELFVVLVFHADRLADIVDDVLVGRRIVAARRFIADAVGGFPVGIDIAGRQGRAGLSDGILSMSQFLAAAPCGRRVTVEVER